MTKHKNVDNTHFITNLLNCTAYKLYYMFYYIYHTYIKYMCMYIVLEVAN